MVFKRSRDLNRHLGRLLTAGGAIALLSCDHAPTASTPSATPELNFIGTITGDTVGATLPAVTVQILGSGKGLNGQLVSFVVTSGGGSVFVPSVITGQLGSQNGEAQDLWTLGPLAGTQSLEARLIDPNNKDTVITEGAVRVTATPGHAAKLLVNGGDKQSGSAFAPLATNPSVLITDRNGNPIAGVAVTFAIASGAGNIAGASQQVTSTGPNGVATTSNPWTLGSAAGANSLTATVNPPGPLANQRVTFTATASPAAALTVTRVSIDPQTATVGRAVPVPPTVKVTDKFLNPVVGVGVDFTPQQGGGSAVASHQITDVNGQATVGSWVLGTVAGANTLAASTPGATSATFNATANAGPAALIAKLGGDAQMATVATPVASAPTVHVTDQYGNPVAGVTLQFTVASGGGLVTGATPTTDASGRASVAQWQLGTIAGMNTLAVTIPGAVGPVLFTATGTAGAPATIAKIGGDNQTGSAGNSLALPLTVLVSDGFGNAVRGAAVSWATTTGGGSINPGSNSTDASGRAQASWRLGLSGPNAATASVSGAGSVNFSATAIGASGLAITNAAGDDQLAPAGTAVVINPAVRITDEHGAPVAGVTVTFSVVSGGGSITSASQVTDANGIATVGSWTLGPAPGVNELQASFDTGASKGYTVFVATGN